MAAGVKKRAFSWFNKMGVCNSYPTALKKNLELSKDHDHIALQWKKQHETAHLEQLEISKKQNISFAEAKLKYEETKENLPHYQVVNLFFLCH